MLEFDNLTKAVTDAVAEMAAVEAKLVNTVVPADVQALADKLAAATAALAAK